MLDVTDPIPWSDAVPVMAAQCGVVMVVGAPDAGKTTLVLSAANAAVEAGRKVAIVDSDVGQSEVGPPGTIGVARLDAPVATIGEARHRALAFVGDTGPPGHLLAMVQGTHRMAMHARERGDDLVLLDTNGMVRGRLAEKLKLAKAALIQPSLIVVLQGEESLERLATLFPGACDAPVLRVRSAPEARRKSSVYRRVRRANRMRRHLEGSRVHDLDAASVRTVDSWVYTGRPLTARQLQTAAQALGTDVPHGEDTEDGIWLAVAGKPDRKGFVTLEEEFRRRRVMLTPVTAFANLLVGLVGEGGHLVEVGLLQGINFQRAVLSILTPARSVAEVTQVHFGRLRVRPDGVEIARLRPSDL